jgi:hypothetical protein
MAGSRRPARAAGAVFVALLSAGCGYVGETLPPLLNIPVAVEDLTAVQRGDRIVVQFAVPRLTTEGTVLREPPQLELRAGTGGGQPFQADAWAAEASVIENVAVAEGRARSEIPAAPWAGREVVFGVKAYSRGGRDAGWSNLVSLPVVAPLEPPSEVRAEAVADGVRLTWQGRGEAFRILRRTGDEPAFAVAATASATPWTDTATEYGKTYHYAIQALAKAGPAFAESERSAQVAITPEDRFPPAAPAGLTAVPGVASIELAWERSTQADLAGYRVYRAAAGAALERLAETGQAPSYSDRAFESGKTYRYAVASVDQAGNESKLSEPVETAAP